jgi:hypothetical protein
MLWSVGAYSTLIRAHNQFHEFSSLCGRLDLNLDYIESLRSALQFLQRKVVEVPSQCSNFDCNQVYQCTAVLSPLNRAVVGTAASRTTKEVHRFQCTELASQAKILISSTWCASLNLATCSRF